MAEQNTTGEYFRKVHGSNIVKKSPTSEKTHASVGGRMKQYAKTWWHERGGPGGVTEAYQKSIDTIHVAIPPGTTEELFRSKIRPILEVRAKAAGYAAMMGEVTLSALTTAWFVQRGRRSAQRFEAVINDAVDVGLNLPEMQAQLDRFRDRPSDIISSATVIDNDSRAIVLEDQGYQRSAADDITDQVRGFYKRLTNVVGAVYRGGSTLAGIATGAAIIERGPVHAVAKLSAKMEGVAGSAVMKIVDRIVRGW